MLSIELRRAFEPEDAGEQACGLCGGVCEASSVMAQIVEIDLGRVCTSCLGHLHSRNPAAFPSVAALEEARRRYPELVYASVEEVTRLEEADDPSVHQNYWAAWLPRA